jgi:hypothetical protein
MVGSGEIRWFEAFFMGNAGKQKGTRGGLTMATSPLKLTRNGIAGVPEIGGIGVVPVGPSGMEKRSTRVKRSAREKRSTREKRSGRVGSFIRSWGLRRDGRKVH